MARWTKPTISPRRRPIPVPQGEQSHRFTGILTGRQAAFYRDLIRLAEALQSQHLPIDFIDATGSHIAMDLGCVKIAEHAGFIQSLKDDSSGYLKAITLSWAVKPKSE